MIERKIEQLTPIQTPVLYTGCRLASLKSPWKVLAQNLPCAQRARSSAITL